MQHPSLKFVKLQFIMMGLALFCGIIGLVNDGFSFFILLMFYTLSLSFLFEGLAHLTRQDMGVFLQQMIRAIIIILFSTILYF
ncbi:hypothetical protein [Pontibacillus sp. HMF3514]|uniref:hypothetical protein n=1 Tax=Pontibacillus sp. HMF3514 TaxID=2692425 RepID=UPI00131FB7FD|nr:hypothetical protein [Pontibacillus sp. HMF3514]QHE53879.1 hypothetical protein GS400_18460 [Pontibacillus sp. HMF3514]